MRYSLLQDDWISMGVRDALLSLFRALFLHARSRVLVLCTPSHSVTTDDGHSFPALHSLFDLI